MDRVSFFKTFFWSLLLCLGGGWLTGFLTEAGIKDWYPHLIKSASTPPNYIFPIAWTVLYTMMALALTLLWINPTGRKEAAYFYFGVQLFLNFIWSWIFFYLHKPGLALIDISILWFFIILTILSFLRHTRLGSYLLIPYLIWVSYALYLNAFILIHN